MAIDAAATDALKADPETFLRKHFVKIANYGSIGAAATWQAMGGVRLQQKGSTTPSQP